MSVAIQFDVDIGGTGTRLQPGLGQAYPGLKLAMQTFLSGRVARLAWLPSNWLPAVKAIQANNPNDLVLIARKDWGAGIGDSELWRVLADESSRIVKAYAAKESADGKMILSDLERNTRFWALAYSTVIKTTSDIGAGLKEAGKVAVGTVRYLPLMLGAAAVILAIIYLGPLLKSMKKG